jgi:hypothetical protein
MRSALARQVAKIESQLTGDSLNDTVGSLIFCSELCSQVSVSTAMTEKVHADSFLATCCFGFADFLCPV